MSYADLQKKNFQDADKKITIEIVKDFSSWIKKQDDCDTDDEIDVIDAAESYLYDIDGEQSVYISAALAKAYSATH
jgi:hypothetical protein